MQSNEIDKLAAALSKAQGQMKAAAKAAENPFFKSKYADLPAVWEACREALSQNGLSVVQAPQFDVDGSWIETTLLHSSGQWMKSRYPVKPVKDDPQGVGSATTYARRYALAAMVGVVADDDDDGNAASGNNSKAPQSKTPQPNAKTAAKNWVENAENAIYDCNSAEELEAWENKNEAALKRLEKADAELYLRVNNALADMCQKLNQVAAE